ncbi:MAG: hypothetical protein C4527_19035 [Candidatus Omnitrophota bacterium]|jgi:hypothetical protein|nr:MAG: hypothetical protein C4527_19035 [Candidatus Omnitrophota bacterium]
MTITKDVWGGMNKMNPTIPTAAPPKGAFVNFRVLRDSTAQGKEKRNTKETSAFRSLAPETIP